MSAELLATRNVLANGIAIPVRPKAKSRPVTLYEPTEANFVPLRRAKVARIKERFYRAHAVQIWTAHASRTVMIPTDAAPAIGGK